MTNEEAIAFLQNRIDLIDKNYPQVKDYREALDMAINSLETPSINIDELEDRLDALHEKIRDSCMEYYIDGQRKMLVDADECAEMIYEILEDDNDIS